MSASMGRRLQEQLPPPPFYFLADCRVNTTINGINQYLVDVWRFAPCWNVTADLQTSLVDTLGTIVWSTFALCAIPSASVYTAHRALQTRRNCLAWQVRGPEQRGPEPCHTDKPLEWHDRHAARVCRARHLPVRRRAARRQHAAARRVIHAHHHALQPFRHAGHHPLAADNRRLDRPSMQHAADAAGGWSSHRARRRGAGRACSGDRTPPCGTPSPAARRARRPPQRHAAPC